MAEPPAPSHQWFPKPEQQAAAEYLASGYSQYRTAQVARGPDNRLIPLRTIQRWWSESPDFRNYVAQVRADIRKGTVPMLQSSITLSQLIVFQVLTGERDAADPVVRVAERVLGGTLYRVVATDDQFAAAAFEALGAGPGPGRPKLPGPTAPGDAGRPPDDEAAEDVPPVP